MEAKSEKKEKIVKLRKITENPPNQRNKNARNAGMCTNDPAVIQGQPITLHLYVKYATNGNMRVFFNYAMLSTDPLHFVEVIAS